MSPFHKYWGHVPCPIGIDATDAEGHFVVYIFPAYFRKYNIASTIIYFQIGNRTLAAISTVILIFKTGTWLCKVTGCHVVYGL